jgi:putative transposase
LPDAARRAIRGGSTASKVVLGGQRIEVRRPRVRTVGAGALPLPTFTWAAGADPLNTATMSAIAAGAPTRRYARTVEGLPADERSSDTSSSAVSRRFVALSQQQLDERLQRRLDKLDLPVVMIDGIHLRASVILVALGIDSQGASTFSDCAKVPPKPRAWCARCCRT